MKKMLVLASLCLSTMAMPALGQHNQDLMMAIEGDHRSAENKARDVYRHPYETLSFFGIEKDDTVVEVWGGAGWYTEILAPYLKDSGHLIEASYDRSADNPSAFQRDAVTSFDTFLAENAAVFGDVTVVAQVPDEVSVLAQAGSVDAILDFRNAHNWLGGEPDNIVKAWHAALKTGGIVGIVDHRRDADEPFQPGTGYTHEKQLVDIMAKHGFSLVASSEVNANPLDTKDHPGGVWNLPPNLRGVAEADRAKFLAIGESDRLTLKFVKD